MAEIKNSFLKSKMNKDLDDRLVPNGEYRDAVNISVGRSEGDDVGALENILGNEEVHSNTGLTCIGLYFDNIGNRIFEFLTNYTDPKPLQLIPADTTDTCKIRVKSFDGSQPYYTLVEGSFLNFSMGKDFLIHSVNLVENQLFWTDNRNQPRKINIDLAINDPNHYKYEWQISVAKYSPITPISLVKKASLLVDSATTNSTVRLKKAGANGVPEVGMTVITNGTTSCNFVTVLTVDDSQTNFYELTLTDAINVSVDDIVYLFISTMTNESTNPNWPGDPDYLEAKYVRFSFRFKYEDDEYSTFAPFSQIAFIPKQKGYFIDGDEKDAFRSTVIRWFENNVNQIALLIPLPSKATQILTRYKISEIDVLYKESDSRVVKILETLTAAQIQANNNESNVYEYVYKSQKPYRSLAENQTTRVYDKVPVRAISQEVSGNRVIYGNYFEGWTPPPSLNYKLTFQEKGDSFDNFIEYPNHTVKENRNYQVGVILADKYNRQSSVILSTLDDISSSAIEKGSTIFAPYSSVTSPYNVKCYNGSAIRFLLESSISSARNIPTGVPGLYAVQQKNGFAINAGAVSNTSYTFTFDTTSTFDNIPSIGQYLRGEYQDYVEITAITGPSLSNAYTITCNEDISLKYNTNKALPSSVEDVKFSYLLNKDGWYSYKIVVRQQEVDYYNSYLAGMLKGYPLQQTSGSNTVYTTISPGNNLPDYVMPEIQHGVNTTDFPVGEENKTAHVVLINDNINKIPRDLSEVGPDQTQYRSSEELFGRVENFESVCELTETTGYIPLASQAMVNYIEYDSSDPNLPSCIARLRVGDGVEGVGSNNTGSINYPDDWYKNTVINRIDQDFALDAVDTSLNSVTNNTDVELSTLNATLGSWFATAGVGVIQATNNNDETFATDGVTNLTVSNVDNTGAKTIITFNTAVDIGAGGVIKFKYPQGTGRIYFQPSQLVLSSNQSGSTMSFKFFLEENRQYYPATKADVVSTIADAKTLGFLPNTLDNVRGTASLNFYNLETNPLIGRISTVKPIGVSGGSMVPFLSIYETKPVESALEVFWETASTGLISDINEDVQTGFDGVVGFSTLNYKHVEDQDYQGVGTTTGASDAKWITDAFFMVDQQGTNLTSAVINSFTVTTQTVPVQDISSKFELVSNYTTTGEYRFAIASDNFVFNHDADELENYTFTCNVTYDGVTSDFIFNGRLQNVSPEIDPACNTYSVSSDNTNTGTLVTMTGNNGSFIQSSSDLFWEIDPSTNTNNYFTLQNVNNEAVITITQNNPNGLPTTGVYNLTIRLTDAWDYTNNSPTGTINSGVYDSKRVECSGAAANLDITIGTPSVNPCIQGAIPVTGFGGNYGELPVYNRSYAINGGVPSCDGQNMSADSGNQPGPNNKHYAGVYIGRDDILNKPNASPPIVPFTSTGGGWTGTNANYSTGNPVSTLGLPTTGTVFGSTNPSIKPMSLVHLDRAVPSNPNVPNSGGCTDTSQGGCSRGVMKFTVEVLCDAAALAGCSDPLAMCGDRMSSSVKYKIFHRALQSSSPNSLSWSTVADENGQLQGEEPIVVAEVGDGASASSVVNVNYSSMSFDIFIDCSANPGEYFLYFEFAPESTNTAYGCNYNGTGCTLEVSYSDANYSYPNGTGTVPTPISGGEFYLGMEKFPNVDNSAAGIEFTTSSGNPYILGYDPGANNTVPYSGGSLFDNTTDFSATVSVENGLTLTLNQSLPKVSIGQGVVLSTATSGPALAYVSDVSEVGGVTQVVLSNAPGTVLANNNISFVNNFYEGTLSQAKFVGKVYGNIGSINANNLQELYVDAARTTPFVPKRADRYYTITQNVTLTDNKDGNHLSVSRWDYTNLGNYPGSISGNGASATEWREDYSTGYPRFTVRLNSNGKLITDPDGVKRRFWQGGGRTPTVNTPGEAWQMTRPFKGQQYYG